MSVTTQEGSAAVPGVVAQPPAPGRESAGPAMTPFEVNAFEAVRALHELLAYAKRDQGERAQTFIATDQTDANGDALLELFSVPAGSQGRLTWCCVDEASVTPAAPDTSGNLYLAIYAAASQGITDPAQVRAVGALLDAMPSSPAADAQIPFAFLYGSPKAAPLLRGPATFYLAIDAAQASRQVAARGVVYVEQLGR